ncbi:MAG: dimethyl sulfoxide reductase anchor subunit family protein [Bacillota bacterium]
MEYPLVFFTVLSQLAAGAMVTLWLLDTFTDKVDVASGRLAAQSIVGITALSLLVSLFHLGHPLNAYRALTNIGSSWVSREVALFTLFLLAAIVYCSFWKDTGRSLRIKTGGVTALIAVLAVLASAMVYVLPARPAWNNISPIVFFLLTAALLGPLYIGILFRFRGQAVPVPLNFTGAVLATSLLVFMVYVSVLLSGQDAGYQTGLKLIHSGAFWIRAVSGWLVPLAMFFLLVAKRGLAEKNLVTYLFILTLVGEIIGRELFYSSVVALQVGMF